MDAAHLGGTLIARFALPIGLIAVWPTPYGVVFAGIGYLLVPRVLRLFESGHSRDKRLGVDREIALLAQMFSAHLIAGAGLLDALDSLAPSMRSQLGPLTTEVAARLRSGSLDPFGPWRSVPGLIALADACTRALRSGASMASAAERVATRVRQREYRARHSDLERAVIRMTLPLGICLLPAFILTVVVPMAYVLFSQIDF